MQQEDNQDNPRTEQSTIHKQSKCDFEEAAESKDNHDQESQTKNIQEQKNQNCNRKKTKHDRESRFGKRIAKQTEALTLESR